MAHTFSKGFAASKMNPSNLSKSRSKQGPGHSGGFHEFALCSLQFRFALRVSVVFHCVEPHPQKNVKPNKRAVSTKSTRIATILNPPAGPLRRFDLLQTF